MAQDSEPRLIKRYVNRKLYDTRESRYVTLQQVGAWVREGQEVRIVDNATKEDLTHVTLAQVIYDEERRAREPGHRPSVGALRGMIERGGERLFTSLREGPVGKLVPGRRDEARDGADAPAEKGLGLVSPKHALDELQRVADERIRGVVGAAMSHVQQLQGEVRRLQLRVEELEKGLISMGKRRSRDSEAPPAGPADPPPSVGAKGPPG